MAHRRVTTTEKRMIHTKHTSIMIAIRNSEYNVSVDKRLNRRLTESDSPEFQKQRGVVHDANDPRKVKVVGESVSKRLSMQLVRSTRSKHTPKS